MTSKSAYILAAFNAEGGWTSLLSATLSKRLATLCREAADWCRHLENIVSSSVHDNGLRLSIGELPTLIQHYSLLQRIVIASGYDTVYAPISLSGDALVETMTSIMLQSWMDGHAELSDEAVLYHFTLFTLPGDCIEGADKRLSVLRGWLKEWAKSPLRLVVLYRTDISILSQLTSHPAVVKQRVISTATKLLTSLEMAMNCTGSSDIEVSNAIESSLLLLRTLGPVEIMQDAYDRLQLRMLSYLADDMSLSIQRRRAYHLELTHLTRLLIQYTA